MRQVGVQRRPWLVGERSAEARVDQLVERLPHVDVPRDHAGLLQREARGAFCPSKVTGWEFTPLRVTL